LPPLVVGLPPLLVGSPPVFVGPLAIGAHLQTQVAKLFEDHPGSWIEVAVLSGGHDHNVSRRDRLFNVSPRIQQPI
jgi:hypothetical protein